VRDESLSVKGSQRGEESTSKGKAFLRVGRKAQGGPEKTWLGYERKRGGVASTSEGRGGVLGVEILEERP